MTNEQVIQEIKDLIQGHDYTIFLDDVETEKIHLSPPDDTSLRFDPLQAIYYHKHGSVPENKDGLALAYDLDIPDDYAKFIELATNGSHYAGDALNILYIRQLFLGYIQFCQERDAKSVES